VEALEGPAAAKAWRVECEALLRALATELGTPEARSELAIAVSRLGDVVEALEGPAAAKAWRVECEALLRALATELGTPQARRGLAVAVSRLGDVVEALEGPASAKAWRVEDEALSRALATELGTPQARRGLAIAVARLGNVVEALEGPAAAKAWRLEEEALSRALAMELGTPQTRRELAIAVARLGDVVEALEGPAAAKAWRLEEEALSRALATELGTPEARCGLAAAVSRLGNVVEALEGPAAAKAWRVEEEALSRALAAELGTPQARRELAVAVSRLGDVVEALEGLDTNEYLQEALHLFEELRRAQGLPSDLLSVLCIRRDILRAALRGKCRWERPFAIEVLPLEYANAHGGEFQALIVDFESWAAEVGGDRALGWIESLRLTNSLIHLARGDSTAARAETAAALSGRRSYYQRHPSAGAGILADGLLIAGLAHAEESSEIAIRFFEEALQLNDTIQPGNSPSVLRRRAVVRWFLIQNLRKQNQTERIEVLLDEARVAAEAFARFGMQDGAAIVDHLSRSQEIAG